jgi:hypothetical protein
MRIVKPERNEELAARWERIGSDEHLAACWVASARDYLSLARESARRGALPDAVAGIRGRAENCLEQARACRGRAREAYIKRRDAERHPPLEGREPPDGVRR